MAFPVTCTATIAWSDHVDDHLDGAWIRNQSSAQPMATTDASQPSETT